MFPPRTQWASYILRSRAQACPPKPDPTLADPTQIWNREDAVWSDYFKNMDRTTRKQWFKVHCGIFLETFELMVKELRDPSFAHKLLLALMKVHLNGAFMQLAFMTPVDFEE
jgi:hypothetical protein